MRFWCSWWSNNNIDYPEIPKVDGVQPIWLSGFRSTGENFNEDQSSFVAVIETYNEELVSEIIQRCDYKFVELRFVEEMDQSVEYNSDRFPWPTK